MDAAILQQREKRNHYFVRGAFQRFFAPALLSTFWLAVAGVADSVYVGNAIGTPGLAAISLGQPIYLFYNILSYGFSIGGSIHYASSLAQGREEEGNRIFMSVLRLLIVTYIVTAALGLLFLPQLMRLLGANPADSLTRTYIRTQLIFVPVMFCQGPFYYFVNADNGPKTAAAAMTLSGLLDALFGYILVYRLRIGVAGSVYSTVAGAVAMLLLTGWHIAGKKGALRFRHTPFDRHAVVASARTGFASSVRYLFEFITMIAVNRILMDISGPVAVAAFDVVYNIYVLCTAISDAAAVATEPMLSSYRSERNVENVRFTLRLSLLWAGALSLAFSLLLALFPSVASRLFGMREGLALHYTVTGIRIFSLSVLPALLNAIFCSYYQAILCEWLTYLITFFGSFFFYLVALFLCTRDGMDSFWYIFLLSELLTLAVWVPVASKRGGVLQLKSIDQTHVYTVLIDSDTQNIGETISGLQAFYEQSISDPRLAMYIGLTIEEICMAILGHVRGQMEDVYIQVTAVVENGECTIYLRDNAYAFDPLAADTGAVDLEAGDALELMGVQLVQKKAKEFYYRRYTGFNTLVIRL